MKEELEKINAQLNKLYKGSEPMITIYGDGSWTISIRAFAHSIGYHTIEAYEQGDTIEQLYTLLKDGDKL